MSIAVLEYMKSRMQALGIPYAFMQWEEALPEYYFVGEYNELAMATKEEDGRQDITLILRGFTRGAWLLLEQARETIEQNITQTAILENGSGIACFYDGATVVPTGDAELKSIKINLTIQEWKVRGYGIRG